ncbi:MAG: aspartate aminotransferase family protein [Lachnospiraceae bacterium]|nr:aspartate aminotransferase family protein [Lachnospiraceae bacterium]
MNTQEIINQGEACLLHTYNRYPVVLDHGEGVYLYDTEGKKYLDFCAGIAVFALGYNQPEFNEAVKGQLDKIVHTSNYFYNEPSVSAAKKLCQASGMDRVFFCNSGTEAIEGAMKNALRYAYNKDGQNGHEIIAMQHSFHGRSLGALSLTGNAHYQDPFRPLLGGVHFAEFNNLDSVKSLVNDRTCAIILEPVQGEGGIYPATPEFLQGLRALCDEKDILLICDEIQCGMGRTGSMFACERYGVKPDIMAVAKALGCGLPIGAFLTTEKAAALAPGDHGSTYGGNPLVCAAADKVFDLYESLHVLENVQKVGAYLYEKLDEMAAANDKILAHRGVGLIQGLEFSVPVAPIIQEARDNGLILINAGTNILRFVPPLIITEEHVDEMMKILTPIIENM